MESVTLENFRCFREKQTVKLAPLTLLVGENSTGKTSFLALLRAMAEFSFEGKTPNFKEDPFDLGTFDEIVHNGRDIGNRPGAAFVSKVAMLMPVPFFGRSGDVQENTCVEIELTFEKQTLGTAPDPIRQYISTITGWAEEVIDQKEATYSARIGTERGEWSMQSPIQSPIELDLLSHLGSIHFRLIMHFMPDDAFPDNQQGPKFTSLRDSPELSEKDRDSLEVLSYVGAGVLRVFSSFQTLKGVFASAPIRSQPERTYNPGGWVRRPEGNHVPMRFAEMSALNPQQWQSLKKHLQEFGSRSGLFDEIKVLHFGKAGSDPFQIQVRKQSGDEEEPYQNLIDVGYGVSQALPLVSELLEPSEPTELFLLQQPEVHLHPRAQAALGSLFCEVAAGGRQLIVETHSDHLIDRIRMDVRDGKTSLTPEDVRILYFERVGLDVKIHEIWYDEYGNLENVPPSYRRFFMEEVDRSIWPPD